MSNIEKDIKYVKELLKIARVFFKSIKAETDYKEIDDVAFCIAIDNILAERKQDKARIQELEAKQEFKKWGDLDNTQFEEYMNQFILKQKVKDKIERHKFAKKDFEKEYDNKNYKDNDLRARDFYMIVAEDLIIKNLKDLLEDK